MTEPDITHAVKEILVVRVVYVPSCFTLHVELAYEITARRLFDRLHPCASCFLEITLQKIQLCVKTLVADISSVTFPEFFI